MKSPKLRRITSFAMALCMLCTLLSGFSLTAAATETYTVTFSTPTGITAPASITEAAGVFFELPMDVDAPEGYTFVGWYETQIPDEITLNNLSGIKNEFYQLSADTTLFACYRHSTWKPAHYEKATTAPPSGPNGAQYLIVYQSENKNIAFTNKPGTSATNANSYNTAGNYISVTIINDEIPVSEDVNTNVDAVAVTIKQMSVDGEYSILLPCGKYFGYSGSSTNMKLYTSEQANSISFDTSGFAYIKDPNVAGRTFSYDSGNDAIKFYGVTKSNLNLYQKINRTEIVKYTTNPLGEAECAHEHCVWVVEPSAPTCTEVGHSGTRYCNDCQQTIELDMELPALGHDFDDGVVTPPSAENNYVGYTTYTCQRDGCGYSEQSNYTGADFTVTYSALGTTQTATVNSYIGAELPTTAAAADGYRFVGWSEQAIPTESAAATVLTGTYKPTANVTLYAVYARDVADTGDGSYVKLTANDPLYTNGKYLIVGEYNGAKAFNAAAETIDAIRNYFDVTLSGSTVTGSNDENLDDAAVTLVRVDGASVCGLQLPGGQYMGTSGGNSIVTSNVPLSLNVTVGSDDTATIANLEGTLSFKYSYAASSDRFRFYAASNTKSVPVTLYYKDGSGSVTYFTTDPTGSTPPACEHSVATWTSNNNGTHSGSCTLCGAVVTEDCSFVNNRCVCGSMFRIKSATLSLNNQIDVVYIAEIPGGFTGATLTVNGTAINEYIESSGSCYFFYTGVNPQCMGDNLSATLTGTFKGQTYTATKDTYSVRQYCVNRLKSSNSTEAERALVTALLVYGANAQYYTGYKTKEYVTSGSDIVNTVSTSFTELSGYSASFDDGEASTDTYWISAGLTLTNGVAMNFRFYAADTSDLSISVEKDGVETIYTENDFTAVSGKTNVYEITFDGIHPDEFSDTVTAVFTRDDSQVGKALSYSVNAYIQSKQNDSSNKLRALVRALSVYGTCVEAFKAG